MSASAPLDSLGRRRSPAAVPGYLTGRRLRSKGRRYPPDPRRTEEIIAVMRCCGVGLHGDRAVDRRSETTGALNNSSRGYRRARRCPSGRCSA